MCKHRDLILSRIASTLNTSPAAPANPDRLVEEIMNQFDDRREYVAQRAGKCSSVIPTSSFYPGYTPEETDDGRLDRIAKTGFVGVDELPDTREEYEITDDDLDEKQVAADVLLANVSDRSGGQASTRDYRGEYDDRNKRIVVEIFRHTTHRGRLGRRELIPYRTAPRSTSPR